MSSHKDGSLLFFGDALGGHVLSYIFQIHDSQARGFFRLYSIIVLMKDKMYLLNVQPFLAENLQKISTELQTYSSSIYAAEQAKYSERAQRLNTGHASTQPPRSLIELTGQTNIFAYIHSHFAWILWMGARCLTENINIGLPFLNSANSKLDPFTLIQLKNRESITKRLSVEYDNDRIDFIRKCSQMFGVHFASACYCAIVGIQVINLWSTNEKKISEQIFWNLINFHTDCFERSTVDYHWLFEMFCQIVTWIDASSDLYWVGSIFTAGSVPHIICFTWSGCSSTIGKNLPHRFYGRYQCGAHKMARNLSE